MKYMNYITIDKISLQMNFDLNNQYYSKTFTP